MPACLAAAAEAAKRFAFQDAALLYERALPHVADSVEQARLLCSLAMRSSMRASLPPPAAT